MEELTLIRIIILALADAVNPCAFAVMLMVLVAILIANPGKKHKVLLGGLTFTLAIFIGYFLYGLILIQLFKSFVMVIKEFYPYVSKALAVLAIILGLLNLRDYISYKPGNIGTEMPLTFRPRVKLFLKKVSSPTGSFFAGIFVTLFLLPCTIGPYIIASETLSKLEFLKIIPWLLLYNLIFILPMIGISLIVYFGLSTTEELSDWKDRKIRIIHLVAGLLLIGLGIGILTGII